MLRKIVLALALLLSATQLVRASPDSQEDSKARSTFTLTTFVSTTPPETSTATSSSNGITTYTVTVGAPSAHKFTPDTIHAQPGDVIEWMFYPTGHWVIRGDYENPCIPYEYVGLNRKGFSSGPQDVQAITDNDPKFSIKVNDTKPIWFYCGAPGSCKDWKMMGVVNPTENETLADWQKKAKDVVYQLEPGDPWPTESAFTAPTDAGDDATGHKPEQLQDKNGNGGSSLSGGAIAGIAIGGVAVLVFAGALLFLFGRRGGFDKANRSSSNNNNNNTSSATNSGQQTMAVAARNHGMTDSWLTNKLPPSTLTSQFGQSPPMSPQQTPAYTLRPGLTPVVAPDGTITSFYDQYAGTHYAVTSSHGGDTPNPEQQRHSPNQGQQQYHHHYRQQSQHQSQERPEQTAPGPVELATSADPGNSPLPVYSTSEGPRQFSWTPADAGSGWGK